VHGAKELRKANAPAALLALNAGEACKGRDLKLARTLTQL